MPDRLERLDGEEEITPAMMKAGLIQLAGLSPEFDPEEWTVENIYRAMRRIKAQEEKMDGSAGRCSSAAASAKPATR